MRLVLGILALVLAATTGYLVILLLDSVLMQPISFPIPFGQVRGLLFTALLVLASLGLLWLAARLFGWISPRTREKSSG